MLNVEIKEKRYHSNLILKNINLSISENGLFGIVGKNGSGKTTFFNCLSHLIDFEGNINYMNKKLVPQKVAFLPTEPFLYEHLSVSEFYTFYRKLTNIRLENDFIFDIDKTLLIKELSTGMRKKTYMNAILQKNYELYIFDEPFNGLDIESVYEVKKMLLKLSENHIVFVSSHILETLQFCKKIFLLKNYSFCEFNSDEIHKIEEILMQQSHSEETIPQKNKGEPF